MNTHHTSESEIQEGRLRFSPAYFVLLALICLGIVGCFAITKEYLHTVILGYASGSRVQTNPPSDQKASQKPKGPRSRYLEFGTGSGRIGACSADPIYGRSAGPFFV